MVCPEYNGDVGSGGTMWMWSGQRRKTVCFNFEGDLRAIRNVYELRVASVCSGPSVASVCWKI